MGTRFVGRRGPPSIPSVQQAREQLDRTEPEPIKTFKKPARPRGAEWSTGLRTYRHLPDRRRHDRYGHTEGFGLYACSNCRWFKEAAGLVLKNDRIKKPCEQWGVNANDLPCPIRHRAQGYFEPLRRGRDVRVQIDHLRADELMLLSMKISRLAVKKLEAIVQRYEVGQPMKFRWGSELREGVVRSVASRVLRVECQDGGRYIVRLGDLVDNDGKPLIESEKDL